jgi:hypothetical protein
MDILRFWKSDQLWRLVIDGVEQNVTDEIRAQHPKPDRSTAIGIVSELQPIPYEDWPVWAKALKKLAMPDDVGIGDVVRRTIGEETSEKFKSWYKRVAGKDCGCNGRQAAWNKLYPLKK